MGAPGQHPEGVVIPSLKLTWIFAPKKIKGVCLKMYIFPFWGGWDGLFFKGANYVRFREGKIRIPTMSGQIMIIHQPGET